MERSWATARYALAALGEAERAKERMNRAHADRSGQLEHALQLWLCVERAPE